MGRRSFISATAINRLIASSRAAQRRKENQQLIQSQSGPKELEPEYSIDYIDFNEQSRSTKIHFRKTVHYRTIDRYIQQNYERYPIYSGWKTKTSSFSKSIKLTNEELENLKYNNDSFIHDFAFEIVSKLPEELSPAWYIKDCIDEDYRQKIAEQNNLKSDAHNTLQTKTQENNDNIAKISQKIQLNEKEKYKNELKLARIEKKIDKFNNHQKNFFLSVITFGIYSYLGSQHRISKLNIRQKHFTNLVDYYLKIINDLNSEIYKFQAASNAEKKKYQAYEQNIETVIRDLRAEWNQKILNVTSLPTNVINNDDKFTSLKSIAGMTYEKIIGCYVIRNTENGKCYVGQSKDVFKRLKQHFKGTVPNNIIFAEDYYSSQNKDNLFEVKILPRTTKDELDSTERQLIEDYDAYNSGYNGTNGNS